MFHAAAGNVVYGQKALRSDQAVIEIFIDLRLPDIFTEQSLSAIEEKFEVNLLTIVIENEFERTQFDLGQGYKTEQVLFIIYQNFIHDWRNPFRSGLFFHDHLQYKFLKIQFEETPE